MNQISIYHLELKSGRVTLRKVDVLPSELCSLLLIHFVGQHFAVTGKAVDTKVAQRSSILDLLIIPYTINTKRLLDYRQLNRNGDRNSQ